MTHAMQEHKDLHIAGPVTRSLLVNLEEYQDAWVLWRPDRFVKVPVSADTVLEGRPLQATTKNRGSVLAFSGGLDSTYTLIANQTGMLGQRGRTLATLAMIHEFDIPLQDEEAFDVASAKSARLGEAFGVPLQRVRTNWRTWSPQWQWGLTFGIGLSSVLQLFSGDHDAAMISADRPYGRELFPWGTNSITNRFMSSVKYPLLRVGFGAMRTEKARVVGQYPLARELVRVCWAGSDLGRNCGQCEKCVCTKLWFLATGIGTIPALGDLDLHEFEAFTTHTLGQLQLLEDALTASPGLPPDVYAVLLPMVARERAKYVLAS